MRFPTHMEVAFVALLLIMLPLATYPMAWAVGLADPTLGLAATSCTLSAFGVGLIGLGTTLFLMAAGVEDER
jgi:hypothetical protein